MGGWEVSKPVHDGEDPVGGFPVQLVAVGGVILVTSQFVQESQ